MALSEMKFQKYFVDTYGEQASDAVAICVLCDSSAANQACLRPSAVPRPLGPTGTTSDDGHRSHNGHDSHSGRRATQIERP